MPEKTVHGYNYRIRIWYPEAPENKTEGTILAAYEEDLANQIQTRYPGVTYEIISKEPVLGDPQQPKQRYLVYNEVTRQHEYRYLSDDEAYAFARGGGSIRLDEEGKSQANPGPDELQFKAPLARAEQFMNELRRYGYDVGHDADYEDPNNYMTVIVRNVPPGRKRLLLDTAERWTVSLKEGNPGNPGNPPQVFTYSERLKVAIKEDPVVGWTHALNLWDSLTPSEKEELRMLWIYQGKEEFTRLQPNILSELFNIGEPLSDLAYLFQAIDKKILLGQSLSGNPGNPGTDQNLRDRLIAEIYNNRMDAWKRGHVGVRSVSAEDLTELRSMSTPELEQTVKLTRQFLFPLKGQIQEQVEYRWEFLPVGQGHYFHADSYERAFYKAIEEATRDVVIFQQWKPREQWKYAILPLHMKGWTPEQVIEHYMGQGKDRKMITEAMEGASIFHQGS